MKLILALLTTLPLLAHAGSWQHADEIVTEVARIAGVPKPLLIPIAKDSPALAQGIPSGDSCTVKIYQNLYNSNIDNKIAAIVAHEMGHCHYVQSGDSKAIVDPNEAHWYSEYYADNYALLLVGSRFNVYAGMSLALGDSGDTSTHPGAERRLRTLRSGVPEYPDNIGDLPRE